MSMYRQRQPTIVTQSMRDSCWAAILESWGSMESEIPNRTQAEWLAEGRPWELARRGPEGGVSGPTLIRLIGEHVPHSHWEIINSSQPPGALGQRLPDLLRTGHVVCIYQNAPNFHHGVMVFDLEDDALSVMDPDGGQIRTLSARRIDSQRDIGLIWRTPRIASRPHQTFATAPPPDW